MGLYVYIFIDLNAPKWDFIHYHAALKQAQTRINTRHWPDFTKACIMAERRECMRWIYRQRRCLEAGRLAGYEAWA